VKLTKKFHALSSHQELVHGRLVNACPEDVVDEVCAIPAYLHRAIEKQDEIPVVLVSYALIDPPA
jgi:hypothetical protein